MEEKNIPNIFEKIGIVLFLIILITVLTKVISGVYKNYYDKNIKNYEWVENHVELVKNNSIGLNVYYVEKNKNISIYSKQYRKAIDENIERLKNEAYYTLEEPLLLFNPYGTNNVGLNIYFETEQEVKVEYSIKVKSTDKIPEYSNSLYNEEEYSKIHEYQIIGLVAGNVNELELKLIDKDNNIKTRKYVLDLTNIETISQINIKSKKGNKTEEQLTNGLYTILGNDSDETDYVSMYDNNGILRMEIPIIGYRAHKLLFNEINYISVFLQLKKLK